MMPIPGRISMDKPSCFFCGSRRQRDLILVGEDALGNPELIDLDGMGVNGISKAIKYRAEYKKMHRIYWHALDASIWVPLKIPDIGTCRRRKKLLQCGGRKDEGILWKQVPAKLTKWQQKKKVRIGNSGHF